MIPGPTLAAYDVDQTFRCDHCAAEARLPHEGRCIGAVREEIGKRTEASMARFYQRHPSLSTAGPGAFEAWAFEFDRLMRAEADAIDMPHAWTLVAEEFRPRLIVGGTW